MLKKQKLSKEDALNGSPIRNPAVTENWIDAKTVQITYPVLPGRRVAGILSLFGKNSPSLVTHKIIELDLLGSYVWTQINGTATVKQISSFFQDEFKLETLEAQMSVSAFLRELGRRGIIAIA